ncbi:hypothetical protein PFISCL1PPCAC_22799, partial [Pristionchus fissidentatus]
QRAFDLMSAAPAVGKARKCKVCDGNAAGAHFGVDSCRACAAFFRRTLITKRKFGCSTGGCAKPRDCKKCRFDRCLSSGMLPALIIRNKSLDEEGSPPIPTVQTSHPDITLLHRLMANYRDFVRERVVVEQEILQASDDCVSPMQTWPPEEPHTFTVYTANWDRTNCIWNRTTEMAVGHLMNSFEELYALDDDDKFSIVQHFIFLLHSAEGIYRASKSLTTRPLEGIFVSYTTLHLFTDYDKFFENSAPLKRSAQIVEKFREINERSSEMLVPILDRMAMTEIEFVALIVIALWSMLEKNDAQFSKIGDVYRKRVFEELHVLYRDEFKLDNYATRLGELMTLSNGLQLTASYVMTELQFLNFFEVFEKGSFTDLILRKTVIKEEPLF